MRFLMTLETTLLRNFDRGNLLSIAVISKLVVAREARGSVCY
jgi:hypothetical protein